MVCLGVGLFGFILFETLCASWNCLSISFTKIGKFSKIIFWNRFSISCSLSSFQHPHDLNVDAFNVIPEAPLYQPHFLDSSFFIFWGCSKSAFSVLLSCKPLAQSSSSSNLLLTPYGVFFTSVIVFCTLTALFLVSISIFMFSIFLLRFD